MPSTLSGKRININLSDADYAALKQMAEEAGMDMSEFMRQSLRTYGFLKKERSKGSRIFLGDQKAQKEVVIL